MPSVSELLFTLRTKGAHVWTADGRLLYDAPRGVLSRRDLDALRAQKSEIIAFLGHSRPSVLEDVPLGRRAAGERVPVTPVQSYFFDRMAAMGGKSRRAPAVLTRLTGSLSITALQRAFLELVRRHEILRASILVKDGVPLLQIEDRRESPLEPLHLAGASTAARETAARRVIQELVAPQIDVASDPLLMARLLVLGELDHVLLIALDHILFDAPSTQILQRDLCGLYAEAAHGRPASLPDIPVQFPDFAVWHHKVRATQFDAHDSYWEDRLRGARHLYVFPERNGASAPPRAARWHFRFDRRLTAGLRAFSLRQRTTLMMSALTAYVATLARWCDTTDLVVPLPTIARRHAELQNTVGPLGTVLHLRLEVRENDRFLDLLARVVGEYESAYEHDDAGKRFAQSPAPPFASNPCFNFSSHEVRTSLQPALDWSYASGPGPRIESGYFPVDIPLSKELTESLEEPQWLMIDVGEELAGTIVYRADRATLRDIRQLEQSFRRLARQMIECPAMRLSEFEPSSESKG